MNWSPAWEQSDCHRSVLKKQYRQKRICFQVGDAFGREMAKMLKLEKNGAVVMEKKLDLNSRILSVMRIRTDMPI